MGQFSVVIPDLDMQISLNETATGAHWAQKTLDTLWAYLDRVKAVQHVEENPEQAARLQRGCVICIAARYLPRLAHCVVP